MSLANIKRGLGDRRLERGRVLDLAQRRAQLLERMRRRRPYKLLPDLPGMTKRKRKYPGARHPYIRLCGCLIRRRRKRRKGCLEPRELKPRPPGYPHPRAYNRGSQRVELAFEFRQYLLEGV